jgi:hypothetical protein
MEPVDGRTVSPFPSDLSERGYRISTLKFSEGSGTDDLAADLRLTGPMNGVVFHF